MQNNKNSIQSPLGKAKGLGSAHHGTGHMLAHDITTLVNIPLVAWLVYTIFTLRAASYEEFLGHMAHPVNVVFSVLFVINAFKHFALELQVVYEDYISCKCLRMIKVVGMKLLFIALGVTTIISILKIAFMAGI